jgi:hypothetical protein
MTSLPKERPILFSAPMVRAILAGSKSQTRRIVKPQPWASCCIEEGGKAEPPFVYSALSGAGPGYDVHETRTPCRCPYGAPGAKLWVRETWAVSHVVDHLKPREIPQCAGMVYYSATENIGGLMKRASMFMPRWASRITLEVTDVRVERLQDISAKDILAEGSVERTHDYAFGNNPLSRFDGKVYLDLRSLWAAGWESISGPGSWDANPFVWVVEFKRIGV